MSVKLLLVAILVFALSVALGYLTVRRRNGS
jgi:hypothetical protein